MKVRNCLPIAIIGAIVIIFTISAFFLLSIELIALNIWALCFLLLSEVVTFGGFIYLKAAHERFSSSFLKITFTVSLFLYLSISLASSIIATSFADNLNWFILIQLAFISLFAIVTISLFAFNNSINRRNAEDAAKVGVKEPKRGGI